MQSICLQSRSHTFAEIVDDASSWLFFFSIFPLNFSGRLNAARATSDHAKTARFSVPIKVNPGLLMCSNITIPSSFFFGLFCPGYKEAILHEGRLAGSTMQKSYSAVFSRGDNNRFITDETFFFLIQHVNMSVQNTPQYRLCLFRLHLLNLITPILCVIQYLLI